MLRLKVAEVAMEHHVRHLKALAAKAGISQNAMTGYWNGRLQRVDLGILSRIARALGVSPLELLEVVEDAEEKKEHVA
jgi:DNA-binding Xre family transcriptional regulator